MLEVNPGSETKLSGFTAVSGFKGGGEAGFKFQRGWEPGFRFQMPRYFVPLR